MRGPGDPWRERGAAAAVLLVTLLLYNANGREIGSYDSRPTALAARELLLRGSLSLNHVVGATPELAERWGFVQARNARYRPVYSPVPSLAAAAITWPFWRTGLIDIRAPLAPALMAKATASLMVAAAAVFVFLAARSILSRGRAACVALAFALGTGLWSGASQTLWQTETTVFGLSLAILAFIAPREHVSWARAVMFGLGLMLAGMARPQIAPAIAVLLAGAWWRWRTMSAALATLCVGAGAAVMAWVNTQWYGHPMGALPLMTELNARIHYTRSTFGLRLDGFTGLLLAPSRGLFVFSPVALVALAGMPRAIRAGAQTPYPWAAAAAFAQYLLYGSYSVWWGGHTYGPRYMLDLLPLLAPLAALAIARTWRMPWRILCGAAFVWSFAVAATGAFCYPHDAWNTDPGSVDRYHERVWDLADNQIRRCWTRGRSPQNFSLFDRAAVRVTRDAASRP